MASRFLLCPSFHSGIWPSAAEPSMPASSPAPAPTHIVLRFQKDAPVLEHQRHRHRTGPNAAATWNRRHRIGANHGGSGGRDALYEGFAHASRAAAPNRPQSLFSYTCCPYAARSASRPFLLAEHASASETLSKFSLFQWMNHPMITNSINLSEI